MLIPSSVDIRIQSRAFAPTSALNMLWDGVEQAGPFDVASIKSMSGAVGARPYAVCKVTGKRSCNQQIDAHSKCAVTGAVTCIGVVVDAKFCEAPGSIKQRAGTDVCVYEECKTPEGWVTEEAVPIQPEAWCYMVAEEQEAMLPTTKLWHRDVCMRQHTGGVEQIVTKPPV